MTTADEPAIEPEMPQTPVQSKKKSQITTWILIGLLAGVIVGVTCNYLVPQNSELDKILFESIFYFVGQGFIRLMMMLVVPLVFCSIVVGAASMSDPKMLGKVGLGTIISYLVTTTIAILITIGLASIIDPGAGLDMDAIDTVSYMGTVEKAQATIGDTTVVGTLLNIIPTNIVSAMADGTMLQVIFFALVLGFILGRLGRKVATVNRFFMQFNGVMMRMIAVVLKVAPIGVFCLIARTMQNMGFAAIVPLLKLIGTVYLGLFIQLIVVYGILLLLGARLNPLTFMRKFLPVMMFAFSTSSSNATIPLNMETLARRIGVSPKVSSFTIPLGATINMDGTAIMQGAAVVFAASAFNMELTVPMLLTVVVTAVMASIGTAGVPGVGTIMLTMVFQTVGLPVEGVAMIMGIDRILDMGRTVVNITGDAVVTTVMSRWVGLFDKNIFDDKEASAVTLEASQGQVVDPTDFDEYDKTGAANEFAEAGDPDRFLTVEEIRLQKKRAAKKQ